MTLAIAPAAASAHPHQALHAHQGAGQVLANGANHGPATNNIMFCQADPGAYGLETAHHGPDAGTPGNADGCYQLDSWPPTSDVNNPSIG
jgi:hypothetical protein